MKKMRFELPQLNVSTYHLENGMDVVICLNEREISEEVGGTTEKMYEYDGNIFRTYKLTEKEISDNPELFLDYDGDLMPTEEMEKYANEMIDAYTEQLISEGIIS